MMGIDKFFGVILSIILHLVIIFLIYIFIVNQESPELSLKTTPRHLAVKSISEKDLKEIFKDKPKIKIRQKVVKILVPVKKPAEELVANKKTKAEIEEEQLEELRQQKIVTRYHKAIRSSLVGHWTRPSHIKSGTIGSNLVVTIELTLNKKGDVKEAKVHKTSGDKLFDRSAVAAIKKNVRFSIPDDPELYEKYFKKIIISFSNPS